VRVHLFGERRWWRTLLCLRDHSLECCAQSVTEVTEVPPYYTDIRIFVAYGGKHSNKAKASAGYIPVTQNVRWLSLLCNTSPHTIPRGKIVNVCGVRGVSSYPEGRRHGYVRAIFNAIFKQARTERVALSCLYPFKQSFYEKMGYCLLGARYLHFPSIKERHL
jgi:predicted acetyltransferase